MRKLTCALLCLLMILSTTFCLTGCKSRTDEMVDLETYTTKQMNKTKKQVIVLVDEYDAPLLASLNNQELNEHYRALLKGFYTVLKSCNEHIRFALLTGVTKFASVTIFSGLNNLHDISLLDEYSQICGITEEEMIANFSPEIRELANKENTTFDDMIALLKKEYDGYHFSKNCVDIYNPFSFCNALSFKKISNYWFRSGTPSFLLQFISKNCVDIPSLDDGKLVLKEDNLQDYRANTDNIIPLLFQTGYLTIKDYDKDYNEYILGYPNMEVKYAFLGHLMKVYTSARTSFEGDFKVSKFETAMREGDIDKVLTLTKALMASIPYDSLPPDKLFLREHNYQTTIYLIFTLMGQYVRTEVHSSMGRSDVEVETDNGVYIFEFKVGGKPIDAIAQIKEAGYGEKHSATNKNIYLIGATISRNKRTLGKWQIEKVK